MSDPNPNNALTVPLLNAWAAIHGEYWFLWTLHWRARGEAQYSDHLLYQRLYEARLPEIDRLAEVIAAVSGPSVLDPAKAMEAAQPFIASVEALDMTDPQKALVTVQTVLRALREADAVAKGTPYEMGVNNALSSFSDSHLEAVYLLQQRLNGMTVEPPRTEPIRPYGGEFVPPAGMMDVGEPDEEAASIFALRRNSRQRKQSAVPQIMDQFGNLMGLLPDAATGSMGKSLGTGAAIGAALYALFRLIRGKKKK